LGLVSTACSGTNLVDIGVPDSASASSSGSSSGAASGGTPGGDDGSRSGSSSSGATPGSDGAASDDATAGDDASTPDATLDGVAPDDGGADDGGPPGDGAATPDGAGHDGTFACGPTLRCDRATQYCSIAPSPVIIGPVTEIVADAGSSRYSCPALPACDASDPCVCVQGGSVGPVSNLVTPVPSCSCSDAKGAVTRTCTNGGITLN
jgi:hypothetical protein